jgi:hypothetical protein
MQRDKLPQCHVLMSGARLLYSATTFQRARLHCAVIPYHDLALTHAAVSITLGPARIAAISVLFNEGGADRGGSEWWIKSVGTAVNNLVESSAHAGSATDLKQFWTVPSWS